MPFTIDYESPYQKALLAERKKKEEQEEIKKLEEMNKKLLEMLEEADKATEEKQLDAMEDNQPNDNTDTKEEPIKRVKFADEIQPESSKEPTPTVETKVRTEEKDNIEVFEGPVQRESNKISSRLKKTKRIRVCAIVLKTEAPTGLYLPNGNKKNCMISGTEVKYFDPSTGIPYSSVEAYKILKSIEQGQVPWLSFTSEHNDTGNVELYLGSRDGTTRHAQGVPEGFDG
ncbi:hypothetical protein Cantr_06869 [Candida viswanathii]|uniref:Vps72/YL1 C-terminal domain-containing protein n=1 Tax=Candida viswanathii TaxID=5486 RepID=A0A367XW10_9ASCO|nr:hypothetical protein Cantr_06869 [Candida viswanathii]